MPSAAARARRHERQARFALVDLYPVTAEEFSAGRRDEAVLAAVIAAGVRIVQLRDKHATKAALYQKAVRFRELTAAHGVLLIINDHLDLAQAVDADGVHLGQDDFPVRVARRLLPDRLIGASTHSLDEALAAQREGADYVNLGPLFPTRTKADATAAVGLELVRRAAPHLTIPFTVMGGINETNLDAVLATGARRIAVVTAITQAPDITAAARHLRRRIIAAGPA